MGSKQTLLCAARLRGQAAHQTSLALTDHSLTPESLAQVQQQAATGQPINIDPDLYAQLR